MLAFLCFAGSLSFLLVSKNNTPIIVILHANIFAQQENTQVCFQEYPWNLQIERIYIHHIMVWYYEVT